MDRASIKQKAQDVLSSQKKPILQASALFVALILVFSVLSFRLTGPSEEEMLRFTDAVMAQDWQAELTKAGERIDAVPSIEEGVRCLYEAMRSFSRVYESVWASYPTGEGFGSLFRTRHRQLLSQIEAQLSTLYARFGPVPEKGQRILLSELILAASQHPEVGPEDLISCIRGGVGSRTL